ncbi:energy transducer TonB [Roseovarius aestuariivivens]|uniref:energy transducer TonB n=1 Tax=Roseovarius aestuariivivens TaxID=1888910 RepID=UPI001080F77E|nr:energy transducer TonB [Roseovarius aestuariivivens]
MNTGQIISGAGHAGLIAWAVFGGTFNADPLPFEVTEVTAISAEEYAALTAPQSRPEAVANIDTPEAPEAGDAPTLSSEADSAPAQAEPEATPQTEPDAVPEAVAPVPEPEIAETPPEPPAPQEDVAVLAPEISARPQAREAPRVAPEPMAPPEPDVRIDEVERQESAPDPQAETRQPDEEATAPEEATTEIVTEAEKAEQAAPSRSLRPRSRPAAPAPSEDAPTQTAQPEQPAAPQTDDSAVADALAEALGQAGATGTSGTPQGPPLTAGEKDGLRVAVQRCWNVGSLSSDALRTTVVVAVSLNRDGTLSGDVRQLSAQGGSGDAARQAFEAARRAILRCGAGGFDLPPEKYDHWREIEMSFNPESMRIK